MELSIIEQVRAELRREFARSGGKAKSQKKRLAVLKNLERANARRLELGQVKKPVSPPENSGN